MKEVIEVLNKVHDFLGVLIRENLIKEAPYLDEEPMLKVSDFADDLWEVIHKGLPCNNAAKIRKALERLREWALMDLNENAFIADSSGNYMKFIKGTIEIANAELAAPPRNIDKINNYGEMVNAWNEFVYHHSNGTFSLASFFVWLFETAKGEQK